MYSDKSTVQTKQTLNIVRPFLKKNEHNSRKQLQMVNCILNIKSSVNKLTGCNRESLTKPDSIAYNYNNYYSKIASNFKQITSVNLLCAAVVNMLY